MNPKKFLYFPFIIHVLSFHLNFSLASAAMNSALYFFLSLSFGWTKTKNLTEDFIQCDLMFLFWERFTSNNVKFNSRDDFSRSFRPGHVGLWVSSSDRRQRLSMWQEILTCSTIEALHS